MKNLIKNIILVPALILGLSSCTDWLELKPSSSTVFEDMWKDQTDVEAVVASCYNAMLQNGFMQRVMTWGELRSDNLLHNDSPNEKGKGTKEMYKSASLSSILETDGVTSWGDIYNVINLCNYVITYAPGVCDLDPDYLVSEKNANVAEAITIRALCYFYLIRTFKELPYVTEPTLDDQQDLMAEPVNGDEIIPLLINDLIIAEGNALSRYSTSQSTRFRITRHAVSALLAEIYLWQASSLGYPNDSIAYANAIDCCDKILADTSAMTGSSISTGFEMGLATNYSTIFHPNNAENSREVIWGLYSNQNSLWQQTKAENLIFLNQVYGLDNVDGGGTRGDWRTHSKLAPLGNDNYQKSVGYVDRDFPFFVTTTMTSSTMDQRGSYCAGSLGGTSVGYAVDKYVIDYSGINGFPKWMIYRVADIYLMKAEAIVESMNTRFNVDSIKNITYLNAQSDPEEYVKKMQEAHSLIIRIYKRSNSENNTGPTFNISETADLVYAERRREFLFEGKRWFDLVRLARRNYKRDTKTATDVVSNSVKTKMEEGADLIAARLASMDALYWPINKSELDRNTKLKQNPYYDSETSNIQK